MRSRSRGFFALPPTAYIYVAVAIVIAMLTLGLTIQTKRLEASKAEYASFVAQTKIVGELQNAETKRKDTEYALLKEKTDGEIATALAERDAATKRLRDQHPRGLELPQAPAASRRPDLACFDRAELERADGELVAEVRAIADEGAKSAVILDKTKKWVEKWFPSP